MSLLKLTKEKNQRRQFCFCQSKEVGGIDGDDNGSA
jgi:hypothetical protein